MKLICGMHPIAAVTPKPDRSVACSAEPLIGDSLHVYSHDRHIIGLGGAVLESGDGLKHRLAEILSR